MVPAIFRRMVDPLPEITESAREYSGKNPDSWMYYRDSTLPVDAPPAIVNVIGGRHISEAGEFDGVWINPDFLPQPAFAGVDIQTVFDLHVWRLLGGYVNIGEFVSRWDRFTLLVELDSQGNYQYGSGESMLRVYTSGQFVPGEVRVQEIFGPDFIAAFDAVSAHIDVNPGSESMAFEWTFHELRESYFQMKQLLVDTEATQDGSDGLSATTDPSRDSAPAQPPQPPPDPHERFVGSMLVGAAGDALGYAIEFQPIDMIRRGYGDEGLTAPVSQHGVAQISDDTQMMLFTLEGLIRAHVARRFQPSDNDPVPEVQHAYQRWLHTQNQPWERSAGPYARHLRQPDGWLITNRALFATRAPGNTCMTGLMNFARTHVSGTFGHPINDSKGCGGVMRAAPAAVWSNDPAEVFHAAAGTAALTHGHPSGYLSAGVLATIVHQLIRDVPLAECVRLARELLIRWRGHEEQLRALDAATQAAQQGALTPEELTDELGQGWTGEEALAIGLYAVLATDNLRDAVLLSVNHSGDSDSTGMVCGNIAGAVYGTRGLPPDWSGVLELHEVIEALSRDALAEFSPGPPTDPSWTQRYPAW